MAKIAFDVSDVEQREFELLPKGVYKMRVKEIEDTTSGKDGRPMLKVTLEVAEGESKGRQLFDYIKYKDDTSQWKVAQFTEALGKGPKGTIDTDADEGTIIVVKAKHEGSEDDEYGIQAKVGSMLPLPDGVSEEAEPEAEEAEEPEATGDEGEGEELTAEDVEGMNKADLKELIKDEELGIRVTKKTKLAALRAKVIEALGLDAIEVPEDWEALAELNDDDLLAIVEAEEMEVEAEGGTELLHAVAEELGIEVPEGTEAEPEEGEEVAYADMSADDLRSECSERGLETKGGKKALIKRLEADDESEGDGGDPF